MTNCPPDDPRLTPVILRRELLADGVHHRAILGRLRSGELARVRHGAYVDGPVWRGCDEQQRLQLRTRAVLRQAGTEVAASHVSALAEWDVPLWHTDLETVHVTRFDRRAGRREAGVRQHHGALMPTDVVDLNGIRVTTPARSALDAMQVLDVEHSLTAVNDLLHRRLTTVGDLEHGRQQMLRWPHSLTMDLVLRLATPACESVGESRVLHMCWMQRLPIPVAQYVVRTALGEVIARVDFAWPKLKVFLEFDGRVKYEKFLAPGQSASDVVVQEKRREERIVEATGWRCVRVTWGDLADPPRFAARIRGRFAAAAAS